MYFAFIQGDKICGTGECKCLTEGVKNIEISEDVFSEIEKYMYLDDKVILNPNYEEEQEERERERVARLSLTRGDVFRGLLQAKGVTRAQIRTMIETNEGLSELEREMALIDFDEALNFYRGNSMIDIIGEALGITSKQLDEFFETRDYEKLVG